MFDLESEFIERSAGEAFRGGAIEIREEADVRSMFSVRSDKLANDRYADVEWTNAADVMSKI